MPNKTGPLTHDDQAFIQAHALEMSVVEIAKHLHRQPDTIIRWLDGMGLAGPSNTSEILAIKKELRTSQAWRRLKAEFNDDELRYFEERYIALVGQFKDDVLPTEQTQIMLAVKLEVLMSRNLQAKKVQGEDIATLAGMRKTILLRAEGDPARLSQEDKEYLLSLETQINGAKAANQQMSKEFVDLETKHQALMKDLKGTRDQRINKIEESKETFIGVIKRLQIEEEREREGRQAELMRRATGHELKRLGSVVTYDDKHQDQPILSAETVELLDASASEETSE